MNLFIFYLSNSGKFLRNLNLSYYYTHLLSY